MASPPAQGGIKILRSSEAVAVVDVPVVTQHKFQQSFVDLFKVPQLQFIDRVLVFPVMPQSLVRTVQTVQKVGDSTAQFLGTLFFNDRCRACFSQC